MITEFIAKAVKGEVLTEDEACRAMDLIMQGQATPVQIAALVVSLKQRGERAAEVAGFVRAMRAHAVTISLDKPDAVDGCGTGGDGAHTFNVSTAASLVAAAAGVTVAKHGNRSVSSRCGSADILQAAGGQIDPGPDVVADNITRLGFGFMFAPRFHPAMRFAAGARQELKLRTVFNILGPLTNPAGVARQLVGVYDREVMPLVAEVLLRNGARHALVVHSRDGLDEISVNAPTDFMEVKDGSITKGLWEAGTFGLSSFYSQTLAGGDAAYNLGLLRDLLDDRPSVYREAVTINAGAMIHVSGHTGSVRDGLEMASDAITTGAARQKLADWVEASQGTK